MDYKKLHEETLAALQKMVSDGKITEETARSICSDFIKESADERTRKEIISIVKSYRESCITEGNHRFDDCIAWLEKQGETSDYNPYRETVKSISIMVEKYARFGSDLQDFYNNVKVKCKDAVEYDKTYLEKQGEQKPVKCIKLDNEFENQISRLIASVLNGEHEYNEGFVKYASQSLLGFAKKEQKPADKVEPKFKVGDFIINGYGCIMQIDGVDGNMYVYHVLDNNHLLKYDITKTEESCHLWTIQDAKDGDVLASNNKPFIYNYFLEEGKYPYAYCGIDFHDRFIVCNGLLPMTHDDVHPSTKEQCDLLFKKMHEAGYEWNAEKKELKKIEQNFTWSEEDEKAINDIMWIIEAYRQNGFNETHIQMADSSELWLNSLKERMKGE